MPTDQLRRGDRGAGSEVHRGHLSGLLRRVHMSGALSRAAVAEQMHLNRSTIMALTAELTDAGLVYEDLPTDTGRAGRPSFVVRPASDRVHVLAFDVAVDRLVAARVALGGVVQDRREAPRSRAGVDLESVVDVLARLGRELLSGASPGSICVGVGSSYCGLIRPRDGVVRFGPDLGWVDQAFGAEMGRQLDVGLPVKVGNEGHLGARAEHERGAGIGFRNLVYLHGDVGVGGGIIVGNRLLDGDSGYACEVGHMLVNPYNGRPCGCGSAGCLEAEVGERALLEAANRPGLIGRGAICDVVAAADAGDALARRALSKIGDWLGIGVVNLVNLFNPGVIIFGGTLQEIYPGAMEKVRARVACNVLPVSRERVRLSVCALGYDTTLIGAAELAFSDLLRNPIEVLQGLKR